jgi:Skp family chaperone for outer membrane proteins
MHEWPVLPELGALTPGLQFAAGALTVTLVQCVIVLGATVLARWRAARKYQFAPDNPRRIWAEFRQLRADCTTSAANLEAAVARLRDTALAQMVERGSSAHQLERLQRALDEQASMIGDLERQKAELELMKERHLLQLHRQDAELSSRSNALATGERTIALLRGLLGKSDRAQAPAPDRSAV